MSRWGAAFGDQRRYLAVAITCQHRAPAPPRLKEHQWRWAPAHVWCRRDRPELGGGTARASWPSGQAGELLFLAPDFPGMRHSTAALSPGGACRRQEAGQVLYDVNDEASRMRRGWHLGPRRLVLASAAVDLPRERHRCSGWRGSRTFEVTAADLRWHSRPSAGRLPFGQILHRRYPTWSGPDHPRSTVSRMGQKVLADRQGWWDARQARLCRSRRRPVRVWADHDCRFSTGWPTAVSRREGAAP
ncbi:hypothetical protein QFZ32_000562 [Streptomyces canus]|nr:hypothetical protein [Streptomyces canus]MDQ1065123.1 hypothetical protein [Streptomyces canus]